jgi:hypothetical protein
MAHCSGQEDLLAHPGTKEGRPARTARGEAAAGQSSRTKRGHAGSKEDAGPKDASDAPNKDAATENEQAHKPDVAPESRK